jgi:hypothetical protein
MTKMPGTLIGAAGQVNHSYPAPATRRMTQLSEAQVKPLLYELCVKLGFCLPPTDQWRLEQEPPVEIDLFADAVFIAEGMDPHAHPRLRKQVCDCIAAHFARAAEGAG